MVNYISNDRRYTYSTPFTDHEVSVLIILFICVIACIVGIIMIVFEIIKKNNNDTLHRLQNMQGNGKTAGICPICGLNLTSGADTCPKCGTKINTEE